MTECSDCHIPLDLEETAEAILDHGLALCEPCIGIRKEEALRDAQVKESNA